MTGVLLARKGLGKPVGSFTQYDKVRVGRGADKQYLHVGEIVPLASLDDIVFGCWDVYPQNAYQAAMYAEVLRDRARSTSSAATPSWPLRSAGVAACQSEYSVGSVIPASARASRRSTQVPHLPQCFSPPR